jgi:hypothetical protein
MSSHASSSTHGHHTANGGGHGSNGHANGHANGHSNGNSNGGQGAQGGNSETPPAIEGWECCNVSLAPQNPTSFLPFSFRFSLDTKPSLSSVELEAPVTTRTPLTAIPQPAQTAHILAAAECVFGSILRLFEFLMSMAVLLFLHVEGRE